MRNPHREESDSTCHAEEFLSCQPRSKNEKSFEGSENAPFTFRIRVSNVKKGGQQDMAPERGSEDCSCFPGFPDSDGSVQGLQGILGEKASVKTFEYWLGQNPL
eukprot:1161013-Pelagomonas_calceolata.AAC.2